MCNFATTFFFYKLFRKGIGNNYLLKRFSIIFTILVSTQLLFTVLLASAQQKTKVVDSLIIKSKSASLPLDSTFAADSTKNDSTVVAKHFTSDSILISKDAPDSAIHYTAKDSLIFDTKTNTVLLIGEATIGYKDLDLKANEIEQVFLSKLSFKDYLDTLASAKTFVYMVGAGVFNLLFLNDEVSVLEINPHRNNSWAQMFGLSKLCRFNVVISNNLEHSSAAAQDELILDSHVNFDQPIAAAITELIASNN